METINHKYQDFIKLKLIKEFILANNRVPSLAETNDLIKDTYKDIPSIEQKGFVSITSIKTIDPESSVASYNKYLTDINDNLDFLYRELERLYSFLSIRAFEHSVLAASIQKKLETINSNASSLLLSKNFSSSLVYSVTENFLDSPKIILDESTVSISSEGISQKVTDYESKDSYISKLSYSVISDSGYLSSKTFSKLESIKQVDGDYWLLEVIGNSSRQKISCALELTLQEETEVSTVKVSLAQSSEDIIALYYASEDKNWQLVKVSSISSDLMTFTIDAAKVKYLKVIITKTSADTESESGHNVYYFKIDSVELSNLSVESTGSTLVCGPYQILDNFENAIFFNRAALSACFEDMEDSWIEFYLSNNNTSWIPVTPYEFDNTGSLISFEKTTSSVDVNSVNSLIAQEKLDYDNTAGLQLSSEDSYLNASIDISYLDVLKSNYISIKRNLPTDNDVFDISSGWFFNTDSSLYETVIIVNTLDGITIELGSSSAYLDGVLVTGSVLIKAGEHTFSTNQNNWLEIADGIEDEEEFRQNDPLYPYNHKLLIEGYSYPETFLGTKIYNGVTEFFGKTLNFVPKSVFDSNKDLDIYTTYTDANNIYFLIHTKKGYDNYINETFSFEVSIPDSDNNVLYLKAIFRNRDNISTSLLKSFTIRVA